jgi:release factor glutamine methyltransferase
VEASVRDALRGSAQELAGAVDNPVVDAEVLVAHALGWDRARLFADRATRLSGEQSGALASLVRRRRDGEPLQYLTGHQAFRHLDLAVGPGVLVPRPETEIVVEVALGRLEGVGSPVVVDVGTGSGAIALSVAVERPGATVWATELSPAAVVWAQRNLAALPEGASRVHIVEGDLLAPLPEALRGHIDLVVANPPYLSALQVDGAAADVRDHEPRVALVSGPSGNEVPRRVIDDAREWLRPGGWLVMESWPGQVEGLLDRMSRRYEDTAAVADLTGSLRVVEGRRPAAIPTTRAPVV